MSAAPANITTSAFVSLPTAVGSGRGVIVTERDGLGIARVAARRGQAARVGELLRGEFGIDPTMAPRCVSRGDVAIAGIGPETWLATREQAGNTFAAALRSVLGHSASVSDQSDAYVILRLAGAKVREALAKLVPIDLHARSFQVGDIVQTVCGYMSVTLLRLEDLAAGSPQFEIWVGRSLAVSLYQAISHSAAEFGFELQPAGNALAGPLA